jgi:spermidine synthase
MPAPGLFSKSPNQQIDKSDGASSRFVFAVAIFLGAFLLFQVEFILGKFLLPWFGGTSGVWTTSMLCFQLALLAGYAYAHWVQRMPQQGKIHLAVLGLIVLFALGRVMLGGVLPSASAKPAPDANPILGIVLLFVGTIGLPFTLLASTAPLLQAWYGKLHRREPYILYSLSNAGSLLALVTYPIFFERIFRMRQQAAIWAALFFVYAIFVAACAWRAMREPVEPRAVRSERVPRDLRFLWLALSACPSAMFLAMTSHLTQDVAPIPLLWALPLAIYLLSFIICFAWPGAYIRPLWQALFVVTTFLAVAALFAGVDMSIEKQLAVFLGWLFVCCMMCHGELVRLLPGEAQLTSFYLTIATGGAIGGLFVAIVAPFLFSGYWELHVSGIAVALVAAGAMWRHRDSWLYSSQPWLLPLLLAAIAVAPRAAKKFEFDIPEWMLFKSWIYLAAALALLAGWLFVANLGRRWRVPVVNEFVVGVCLLATAVGLTWNARQSWGEPVYRHRNFYGALTVNENELNPNTKYMELMHGRITHGNQLKTRANARYTPTTYYNETSGAGIILKSMPSLTHAPLRVGAVGLGVGTLSAYAKMGDSFHFYEINPTVIELAQSRPNPWFDYVPHARAIGAEVIITQGDARLSLERELAQGHPARYDVILVDAFNGDSIPIHLLTVEAMEIYLKHLRTQDSVIALHISNRSVDLQKIAAGLAQRLNLYATMITSEEEDSLNLKSDWVLLSRNKSFMNLPEVRAVGVSLISPKNFFTPPPRAPVWTDDFSNVWQVLDLKGD